MTSRERVLKALRRQGIPDRPPFEISWGAFTPGLMKVFREKTGTDLSPEEYFDFDVRWVNAGITNKKTDFNRYFKEAVPQNVLFNEWGVGAVCGRVEHFMEIKWHPLLNSESVEDIHAFEWPDIISEYRYETAAKEIKAYKERGYPVAGDMYATIFETAWQLRGMEKLLIDFCTNEEIASAICNKLGELRARQAAIYAMLGVDIIRLGDDVATQNGLMMSVDMYRRFLKGPTKRVIDAAKAENPDILVFMHCDGKVGDLIQEFIDIGVDILNPVQPECNDLDRIKTLYGRKISLWGGIGTQSVMPFGNVQEVKDSVRKVIQVLGKDGGFLLAPAHILEPEVPWENVMAFIEEARNARYKTYL